MRTLVLGLLACALFTNAPTPADAGRGGGTQEIFEFVSTTELIDADGNDLALCHLIKQNTAFGLPILSTSKGYALAVNNCETETYYKFTSAELMEAQAEGLIATDIPAEPSIGLVRTIWKYTFLSLVGLAILFGIGISLQRKFKTSKRRKKMGNATNVALNTLDAMCHIAKVDGDVDASEIRLISDISEKLTGTAFSDEKILEMIDLSDARLSPKEFSRFSKGLKPSEYRTVMQGVMMVAAADGQMAEDEKKFIGNLSASLKMPQNEVVSMLRDLLGGDNRTQPSPA